ncbi:MAG: hypothetical protein HKN26_13545 [Acidimicrobiales bacterium]|nr:hypothetical protein [Acidimicrobiales bacterium]
MFELVPIAFGAGLLAAFNPCGFALLPTYLTYFLGFNEKKDEQPNFVDGTIRGLTIGLVITASFVAVFGLIGVLTSGLLSQQSVLSKTGYVTVAFGILMIPLGIAMAGGMDINLKLPKMNKGGKTRDLRSVFLFGVSYAVVSLGCTFGPFLIATSNSTTADTFGGKMQSFLSYGLGMGAIVMFLTLSVAAARQGVVRYMRRVLPYVNRVSGVLLVVVGVYMIVFGWFEISPWFDDRPIPDAILDGGADFQNSINTLINDYGSDPEKSGARQLAEHLGIFVLAVAAALGLAKAWMWSKDRRAAAAVAAGPAGDGANPAGTAATESSAPESDVTEPEPLDPVGS